MTMLETIARALKDARDNFGYSIRLTRLVDDVATYTLDYQDGSPALEFESNADANEHVAARRALADARAVVEAMRVPWEPIETAPKDGSPILIFLPDQKRQHHMPLEKLGGDISYKLTDPRLDWYDDWRFAIGYWRPWGGWGNRNSADVNPTHWMPLPAPPAILDAREERQG